VWICKVPATTWSPNGGVDISWGDPVVYHMVVPRVASGNGRSCLKGTGKDEECGAGTAGRGTGGWSGA